MIYCGIDLKADTSWALARSLENAECDGIEVQAITDKTIIVTFRLPIWTHIAKGNLACVDIATYHMHRLYMASKLDVLAMFPGGFVLRMGAAKSFELDKNPYKFNETINTAIKLNVLLDELEELATLLDSSDKDLSTGDSHDHDES